VDNSIPIRLPAMYHSLSSTRKKAVREEYVRIQKGKCSFCKKPLTGKPARKIRKLKINESIFPPHFLRWPVHLHHDHNTGLTLGAVHCYCNAVLFQYYVQ